MHDSTRLLCAGAYLESSYRSAVIDEIVTHDYRTVAPSYGYDALPVVAHALAAHRLHRQQYIVTLLGAVAAFLVGSVVGSGVLSFLLIVWVAWAAAFLRRVTTMQILMTRLKPAEHGRPPQPVDFPTTKRLTTALVDRIMSDQHADTGVVVYGRFNPFVGAGPQQRGWTFAQLLLGTPADPMAAVLTGAPHQAGRHGFGGREPRPERKAMIPFSADELMDYLARRLKTTLHDDQPFGDRLSGLIIERRRYGKARMLTTDPTRKVQRFSPRGENRIAVGPTREYLNVRVEAWNGDLITFLFIGVDVRDDTLYCEFYSHVMPPVRESFSLVERLPETLDFRVMRRIARDTFKDARRDFKNIRRGRGEKKNTIPIEVPPDYSEFGLARYSRLAIDPGAVTSIRELARTDAFPHFFQSVDKLKHTQIVERRLFQVLCEFLEEHHVDPTELRERQASILNNYGNINTKDSANVSWHNSGNLAQGAGSSIGTAGGSGGAGKGGS